MPPGVILRGGVDDARAEVLTPRALALLADVHRTHDARRRDLLTARAEQQARLDAGGSLDFLDSTAAVRAGEWTVAPPAPGLEDRRVEITGPTDRKSTVNALNSGANVWLADFEDATTPTWDNVVDGQVNLLHALTGRLDFVGDNGKRYRVGDEQPTIVVRPRGLHLPERHVEVDGVPVAGAFVDAVLYLTACAHLQVERGRGPYLYLPKLESHLEARLWDDVITHCEQALDLPHGTVRATVLIETVPAAFEMDEILYELRDHMAGLNAGRWDYLFSMVKKFREHGAAFVLPDRNSVTMTTPMMRAYTSLLVATCHRRGAHAIGGMAAFIPNRRDPAVNRAALERVGTDKRREAGDGFDGSWVAHPDLVPVCRAEFDAVLSDRPNQLATVPDVHVTAADLLDVKSVGAACTPEGLRGAVSVCLRYVDSWLAGRGAAAIDNLMEDVATAEICRSQLWQWRRNGTVLSDGTPVTADLLAEVVDNSEPEVGATARCLVRDLVLGETFAEFLTLPAYDLLD